MHLTTPKLILILFNLPIFQNFHPIRTKGEIRSVEGTDLDLRNPVSLEKSLDVIPGGLDHTYCLDSDGSLKTVARY